MKNSSDIFRELLDGIASIVWSTTSESTIFDLSNLVRSSMFLQPMWYYFEISGYCTIIFRKTNIFGCFRGIIVQFELVKPNFPF